MTTPADPALDGIASRRFRLVRKGFDPEEVRTYLEAVDAAVARLAAAPAPVAPTPVAPAPVAAEARPSGGDAPDDPDVAVAAAAAEARLVAVRAQVAELEQQRAALVAWFGEEGRADPSAVPPDVADASARAEQLVHEAQLQVDQLLRDAESQAASSKGDRWDDLGEHVARILAHAEEEAIAIRAAADVAAAGTVEAAEQDRAAAREQLAQTQQQVLALVSEAEAQAASIRDQAEPRARAHIAEVLATGRQELDRTAAALAEAHRQLEQVHLLVGQSLAARPPATTLDPAERFVVPEPAAGSQPDGSGPDADPEPSPQGAAPTSDQAAPVPEVDERERLLARDLPEPVSSASGPVPTDAATAAATATATEPPPVTASWPVAGYVPGPDAGTPVVERAPAIEAAPPADEPAPSAEPADPMAEAAEPADEAAAGPAAPSAGPVTGPAPLGVEGADGVDHKLIAWIAASTATGVPSTAPAPAGEPDAPAPGADPHAESAWAAFVGAEADADRAGDAGPAPDGGADAAADPSAGAPATPSTDRGGWASRLRGNRP